MCVAIHGGMCETMFYSLRKNHQLASYGDCSKIAHVFFSSISHGGFQLAMGVPQKRWMVYFMDHPIEIRMIWGYPYDSGNHQIVPVLNARKIAGLLKK